MGRDGARRVAQPAGELGRRRRPVERAQDRGAAVAEQELQAAVEAGRLGAPTAPPCRAPGSRARPPARPRDSPMSTPRAKTSGMSTSGRPSRCISHCLSLTSSMIGSRQRTLRMQIFEHRAGPRERERAGAGQHLALEHRAQPRPVVGQRRVPVGVHRVGEAVDHLARRGRRTRPTAAAGRRPSTPRCPRGPSRGRVARTASISSARLAQRILRDRRGEVRDVLGQRDVEVERAQFDAAQGARASARPTGAYSATGCSSCSQNRLATSSHSGLSASRVRPRSSR